MTLTSSPLEALFSDTSQSWDLDRLYKELAKSKQAPLSPTERVCLRGLLSGVNPTEIAATLHRQPQGLRVDLTRGLYRHLETLTLEKIKNWRSPVTCLEKAGYRRSPHSLAKMLNQLPTPSSKGFVMLEQPLSNPAQNSSLYEQDFYQWTQEMAIALRAGRVSGLDWENLAEEIESLGKSDRRSLQSRLEVLIMHLLKWQYQPSKQSNSWRFTVTEQRLRIQNLLADSPSLKVYLETELPRSYQNACKLAAAETGLGRETFPADCPYKASELLNDDLYL